MRESQESKNLIRPKSRGGIVSEEHGNSKKSAHIDTCVCNQNAKESIGFVELQKLSLAYGDWFSAISIGNQPVSSPIL